MVRSRVRTVPGQGERGSGGVCWRVVRALALICLVLSLPAAASAQAWGGIAWCGDTAAVASEARGSVAFVDAASFDVQHFDAPFTGLSQRGRQLSWSPDCAEIAVVDSDRISVVRRSDGRLRRMQLPAGLLAVFGHEGMNGQSSAAWAPSGRVFVAHLLDGWSPIGVRGLVRFDATSGQARRLALPSGVAPMSFGMLDDDTAVVAGFESARLLRVSAHRSAAVGRPRLEDVRIGGSPLTVVGTRPADNGARRVVRVDPRTGRERQIVAGLYWLQALSDDGSAVVLDDHLMHLSSGQRTSLWVFGTGRGRSRQRFSINPDRTQGSPDWVWDASANRVVGNPDASDGRFGSHPVSYRQPHHTHFVVDDGTAASRLVFAMGTLGDPGPWVEEHGVSPDGQWDLFVVTQNAPTVPTCPPDELGMRVLRSLMLVELSSLSRRTVDFDVVEGCRPNIILD